MMSCNSHTALPVTARCVCRLFAVWKQRIHCPGLDTITGYDANVSLGTERIIVAGILHVCTANQIRSPMAAMLMGELLRRRSGPAAQALTISSAGLHAVPGVPLHPLARAELDRLGVPHAGFTSTVLEPYMVTAASLVLTATRRQRELVIAGVPQALHHTFTCRELAFLMGNTRRDDIPGTDLVERLANVIELGRRRRAYAPPVDQSEMDVADPMGGPRRGYRRAARQIADAVEAIVAVL
jgi:protein-tyrosine phosphatase